MRFRQWGQPVQIEPLDTTVDGESSIINVTGQLEFTMSWQSVSGHEFPQELGIHQRTGAIFGTPSAPCEGHCVRNYTIDVFASDDVSQNVMVERFTLVLGHDTSYIDGSLDNDDDDDNMPLYIGVAAAAVVFAALVMVAVCYVCRPRRSAHHPATKRVEEMEMSTPARGSHKVITAAGSPGNQQTYVSHHLDITDDANSAGVSLQNGAYLEVGPLSTDDDSSEPASLDSENSDESQPWFVAGMRRTKCENFVAAGNHGDFLVRPSRGSDMFVLVVNDEGSPTSFPITRICDEENNQEKYVFGAKLFDSIRALIKFLRISPLTGKNGSVLQLQSPAPYYDMDETASMSFMSDISSASEFGSVSRQPWFAGKARRSAVEASVLAASNGDYLVRESSKGTHYVLCINDNGLPLSFQIKREGSSFVFYDRSFASIYSLIDFLRTSPLMGSQGNVLHLKNPAPLLPARKSAEI